jgi:hypothetical protein
MRAIWLSMALATAVVGCTSRSETPALAPLAVEPTRPAAVGPVISGPVLGSDGRCTGPAPDLGASIEPGIAECDLVRLKGKAPTDVLVGESGKGQREVQVLYSEPGGRELYFFVDNRLQRIVR